MDTVNENQIIFKKSTQKNKKYMAILPDGKTIHLGDKRFEHYKDVTPLKLYSHLDHNDPIRRELYYKRHNKDCGKYSADNHTCD